MDIDTDIVVASVADERRNKDVEMAVNRGIAAAVLAGIPEGMRVMLEAGVPKEICTRVLNSQTRRRASDWH
ncbi:hypothetical protein [Sapientia aquatica]|jgi:hypothetical protein|uniref:Uncharacterized protein n=1 Tax=Sapientia aquatica TaxID=1549640 RepID=A0A4R5VMD1_9BURK|nr:hypothetical protein [Sapientia aquatica]TDK59257.1 hypothetical protein E2I14_18860 [Sapientia aquatica]